MSESANTLTAHMAGGGSTVRGNTDPIVEDDESQGEEGELDSTETETETEESTEEESTDEPEEKEELPDAVKDILTKNRKELRAANARAVAAEKALAAKESGTEEATATDAKFKDLYLNSAAKQALVEAGITTSTDRFLKMLDLSSVSVDESGAISGLEDQIADLKEDFKDLLATKPAKKSVGSVDGSRRPAPAVPKTSSEILAARL